MRAGTLQPMKTEMPLRESDSSLKDLTARDHPWWQTNILEPDRHPGDLLRVVLGVLTVITGAALIRVQTLTPFEEHVFRLFNQLPAVAINILGVVMQLGNALAPAALALIAIAVLRKWQVPFLLVASGYSGWGIAKVVKVLVGRGRPADLLDNVVSSGAALQGFGYPSGHATVAAALATALAPYLPRAWRRFAWSLVWLVALGRMAAGAHLPLDVVGGIALGWAIGSAWHLLIGSPTPRLPSQSIDAAFAAFGLSVISYRRLRVDARGSIPLRIETTDGPFFGKVLLGVHRDADWLFKAWRRLSLRRIEDETPFLSIKQQVEHEAYLSILAQRAGVATPTVTATASIDRHTAILVTEWIEGTPLSESDHIPDDLWPTVARMHAARIAHRDLRMSNVLQADGTTMLLDFGFAEASASEERMAMDVAELLVNTALLAGPTEALHVARESVPPDRLDVAATYLQPLALAGATRAALHDHPDLLEQLRRDLAGDTEVPLEPMARFRWRYIVYVIALGVAVHALLPQLGEFNKALKALASADYWLLGAALIASAGTYVATAWTITGTVTQQLSMTKTTLVQLANQFLNILAPAGVAGFSANVRYLIACGVRSEAAVAGVGLNMVVGLIVHSLMLVGAAIWVGSIASALPSPPEKWVIAAAVAGIAVLVGVLASRRRRRKILESVVTGFRSLGPVVRNPHQALALFGGAVTVNLAYILALFLALRAVGAPATLAQAAAAYLVGAIVGSLTPTPGGLGGTEAALVAALTGLGLTVEPAVAGVLAFRGATFWLPILPGAGAARYLRSAHLL